MKNKLSNIIISFSFLGVMLFFSIANIIVPDKEISLSERRKLADIPEFSYEAIFNDDARGKSYFENLEEYLLDHFVVRDAFRTLNTVTRKYGFLQKDVNGIYTSGGSIFKIDHVLNEKAVERSANVYLKVIERYFRSNGANIYYTVVPDKNFYSAPKNGYLSLDYDKMLSIMHDKMQGYEYIDITGTLSADDYYRTDLHWDQSKIIDTAALILSAMGEAGAPTADDYIYKVYNGFEGAYYGQAALPLKKDDIVYLTNSIIERCKVFDLEKSQYVTVYAEEKLGGIDSYDVFLWGAKSILTIENPDNTSGKELVLFRDSFGSSLAPLLISSYSKITLVDIRYVSSANIGRFVNFSENCDVLFMYNTGTLNTTGQGSVS